MKLKELLEDKRFDHNSNFNFSILEVHSKPTNKEVIIQRKKHWKDILLMRKF